jgi:hypothetical protein
MDRVSEVVTASWCETVVTIERRGRKVCGFEMNALEKDKGPIAMNPPLNSDTLNHGRSSILRPFRTHAFVRPCTMPWVTVMIRNFKSTPLLICHHNVSEPG